MAQTGKQGGVFFPGQRTGAARAKRDEATGGAAVPPPLDGMRGFRSFDGEPRADGPGAPSAEVEAPERVRPEQDERRGDAWTSSDNIVFPRSRTRSSRLYKGWFAASFVAPVVLAALYLFLLAPDRYVTEFRFSVREPVAQMQTSGGNAGALQVGAAPVSGGDMLDNYTVTDFARSRQAAEDIGAKLDVKAMFNRPADPFSRIGGAPSKERLAKYWRRMVDADYDPASGLAVVRVSAYTAADSYAIANALLARSSDLINGIGQESQADSLRFAKAELERATGQVVTLRTQLDGLRRQHDTIDPMAGAVSGNNDIADKLKLDLAQTESQVATLTEQLRNPNAPQIRLLQQQVAAMRDALQKTQGSIAGSNRPGLAAAVGQFEALNQRLASAVQIMNDNASRVNQAQAQADAQRLYLATYVKPSLPEQPSKPDRLLDLLIVAMAAGMVFLIGLLLGKSVMDHAR